MDYLLLERIGTIAGARLHRARIAPSGITALVKLVDASEAVPGQLARFRREYEVLCALRLAGVVKPTAFIDEPGRLTMVLGELDGEALDGVLRRARPDLPTCLRWACQLAEIVAGLHANHLIHRDVRPANFLVTAADNMLCLLDVSLSVSEREPTAVDASPIGDWAYVSPEQTGRLGHPVDYRSDLYSLGVELYQLLTGQLPFTAHDPLEWAHCHIARTAEPPDRLDQSLPPPVAAIVMKLLAKLPEDRYQSAYGLRHDLAWCLAQWEASGQIAAFPLGQEDYAERFQLPRKIYGRQAEVAALLAAFERMASTGVRTLATVTGPAGVGKSSVIDALRQPVLARQGYFIVGKFDQYQRATPYATMRQAIQELVRQLLTESEARIADWRQRIQHAVGANGQLIIDMLPQVALIIGPQPPVPELPPIGAQNRFRRVLRQFLDVFTQPAHPLVLVLDDVQWIDAASLELIQLLLIDTDTRHLLLITAYREHEVDATHPLLPVLDKVAHSGAEMLTLAVAPLPAAPLNQLVAELLHLAPDDCAPLTRSIVAKTGGNPFFFTQFLGTLHREGLLRRDPGARGWLWDLAQIRARDFADNVADLMAAKLQRLPALARKALQLAACLGNRFDLRRLALVSAINEEALVRRLRGAFDEGLLVRDGHTGKFPHDRIQQAAYSRIAPDDRAALHLRIGRVLLAQLGEDELATQVFDVANQFNLAAALLDEPQEKAQVAALQLRAGRIARASAAYASACTYLAAGMALLVDDDWSSRYDLAFNLWLERADCELLAGRLDEAADCIDVLLQHGTSRVDLAAAYNVKIQLHLLQAENLQGIESGLACLRLFGIDVPTRPTHEQVQAEYAAVWRLLGDRPVESLVDLPLMTDPDIKAAMGVLSNTILPAYFVDMNLTCVLDCRALGLGLQHGASGHFAHSLAGIELLLGTNSHGHRISYRCSQVAVDLVEKHGFVAVKPLVYYQIGSAAGWVQPLSVALDFIGRAFRLAHETGDLPLACFAASSEVTLKLARGEPLDEIWRKTESSLEFIRKSASRYPDVGDLIIAHQRLILAMQGRTATFASFSDAHFDEAAFEDRLTATRMQQLVFMYWTNKLQARFLYGDYAGALTAADRAAPGHWAAQSRINVLNFHYYAALTLTALYETGSPEEQRAWRKRLAKHHDLLREWREGYPPTFEDKHALVAAELARLKRRESEAMRLYQQAIAAARENGFVHNEGIAHELAARFCLARQWTTAGHAHLAEARACFMRWGAAGKVAQLDARYPSLRAQPAVPLAGHIGGSAELDLLSIAKASQAISGRIVLRELVDTLMQTVLENAGAQSGALLLVRQNQLLLAADAGIDGPSAQVAWHAHEASPSADALPVSILNYVRRSREQVLLADVAQPHPFAADPYLLQRQPKSVLCLPIVRQDVLLAMLYLEHSQVPNVFTPARLAVLQLLAAQAAISLENALLYADLQEREARIRRLVESNIIGVFFYDLQGNIGDANNAFLNLVGYAREDLLDGRLRWQDLRPAAYREMDIRLADELTQGGAVSPHEKELIRKDGRQVPVLLGAALLEGPRQHGVAFVLDLSDQKQAEQRAFAARLEVEQQKAVAAAEAQANQAKRMFLANMSHELRSPLNVMLGFCQLLLRDDGLPPAAREDLGVVYQSGQHLFALINQVLDLSKIEAGRMSMNPVDFDLHALLDELTGMFALSAGQKGLDLTIDRAPALSRHLHADVLKLRQVLINLLNNAIKFTREGGVILNVDVRHSDQAQSCVLSFAVTDSGPGMTPDELEQLGGAFVQAKAGQQALEGTGLGLAISRHFVQLMGGELTFSSRVGKGTRVAFAIPAQGAPDAPAAANDTTRRAIGLAPGQPQYRVLAVDDAPESRQLLVRMLAPLGFAVREARDGEEAIAIWQQWQPQLILTDLRMPVMDGRQMARQIRASNAGQATVIIAISASGFEEDREATLAAGCNDLLHKPFRLEQLLELLQQHLGLRLTYADYPTAPPAPSAAAVALLPEALRGQLEQALVHLDMDGVQQAIATIRSQDAALADALDAIADRYDFDLMLALLDPTTRAAQRVA